MTEIDGGFKKGDSQTRFFDLGDPWKEIVVDDVELPILYAVEEFRRFDGLNRAQTNISKTEKWLPYIYWKEGIGDKPRESHGYSETREKASIFGEELHRADVLFNLITQGTVGSFVKRGLPSAKQETLDVYYGATEEVEVGKNIKEEELFETMTKSWENFLKIRQTQERDRQRNLPMFPDMGFTDPLLNLSVLKNNKLLKDGRLLAKHWASQYFKEEGDKWEYGLENQSLNEVLIVLYMELLQINGRFDRVTRQSKTGKTVSVQITDFKTGNRAIEGEVEQEIRKRQAQLALFMAERFTVHYMLNNQWLNHKGLAFPMKTSVLNSAFEGRARFVYRWFNEGEIEREEVVMDDEDRKDFLSWLIWYSTKAQEYKEELKKLI